MVEIAASFTDAIVTLVVMLVIMTMIIKMFYHQTVQKLDQRGYNITNLIAHPSKQYNENNVKEEYR